jgi:hypothetical protein
MKHLLADFDQISRTVEGRRFMFGLLRVGGLFESSYRDGNPTGTAYCEGKRSFALEVMALFSRTQHSRVLFIEMLKENFIILEESKNVQDEVVGPAQHYDDSP